MLTIVTKFNLRPRMTICFWYRTRGTCSNMSKHKWASNLLCQSNQIDIIPCWCNRSKDTRCDMILFLFRMRFTFIPPNSKTVAYVTCCQYSKKIEYQSIMYLPLSGLLKSIRKRESKDWFTIECFGLVIN
jgi:hypothetical protein